MQACNRSVADDEETKGAIVINPGNAVKHVKKILAWHDVKMRQIIATQGHINHAGGGFGLTEQF